LEKIKNRKNWLVVGAFALLSILMLFSWNSSKVDAAATPTTVVVNPGHGGISSSGGSDPGAVSNGYKEVDLNNALAIKTVLTLRASGYNAMLSHPVPGSGSIPTLLATAPTMDNYSATISAAADKIGADLIIAIHHNSDGGFGGHGYEFYWSSYHPGIPDGKDGLYEVYGLWANPGDEPTIRDAVLCEAAEKSKELANSFNENFKSLDYITSRDKITERDDAITRLPNMPSVLIEAGFVSNSAEVQQLADGNNQQKMADQILKSVNSIFGTVIEPMTASGVTATVSGNLINVSIKGISAPNGIKQIQVPVWSDINGQDDIKWYAASAQSDGSYSVTIDSKDHNYDGGIYNVHCYGTDNNGKMVMLGNTTVNVKADSMTATSLTASVTGGKISATVKGITAPNGIRSITLPVWSDVGGQDDIKWYVASAQSDGSYSVTIDSKDHNYDDGIYNVHCYGTDNNGKMVMLGNTTVNVKADSMTAASLTASVTGGKISATVKGITAPNGIRSITLPVWSDVGGQDDIKWYAASAQSDGSYSVTIDSKDHNYDGGIYNVHCYGTDNNGKMVMLGNTTVNVKADSMTATSLTASVTGGKISATVKGITAPNGIRSITLPVWSDVGGQDDIKWYVASAQSDGSYSVTIDSKDHNYDDGIYNVHCYGTDNNGKMVMLGNTTVEVEAKTLIMGTTSVTTEQIVDYYESSGKVFPQYYIDRGVNLETFVNMYIQESESEGVRAEVAFAQAMLETGYLQFSGDVKIGQFNFAGFGATGGVPGYDFAAIYGDSRVGIQTGIRAHIQHLKCYASDLPLNQVKVDPRWGEWIRLRATTVEALSGTWATDTQYATKILNIINRF